MAINLEDLQRAIGADVGRRLDDPGVVTAAAVAVQLVAIDIETTVDDLPDDDAALFAGITLVGAGVFVDPPASSSEIQVGGDEQIPALYAPADLITAHSSYWQHLRPDLGAS